MPGVKTNFIYNTLLTMTSYIVSFLVFPYVSRVLGVDGVGQVGFANNVVSIFSLFAFWGVREVAIREISSCGKDRESRSKVFSSFIVILLTSTLFISIIYIISIFAVPRFRETKDLLILGSISLVFTSFLIDWLYQGMENFKYITVRSICVRLAYAILVFIFVREPDDYLLYYALSVFALIINTGINLIYSRKFVDFSIKDICPAKYLNSIFFIGLYTIMGALYTTFNVTYLGFVSNDSEVGYYVTAMKLYTVIIGIISAFTAVMLPKMSSLLSEGRISEFREKTSLSFEVIAAIVCPVAFSCVVLAPEIIRIIAGGGYEGAVFPLRISMVVFILSSLAHVWVIQVLMPLKKDKIILVSAILGAVAGIGLDILLVGRSGAKGAALVLLSGEILGNIYGFIYALKNKLMDFPWKKVFVSFAASIPYIVICIAIKSTGMKEFVILMAAFAACLVYFIIYHTFLNRKSYISNFITDILSQNKKL